MLVQAPRIVGLAAHYWLPWVAQHNKKISAVLLFLGNPGWLPQLDPPIKSGLKLGNLPVNFTMLGGAKNTGSLIGTGFYAKGIPGKDAKFQVWQMDYHKLHPKSSKDIALIPDGNFHYHILDPYK